MVWKASDGPIPLAQSLKGVQSHAIPPSPKNPLKRHFQHSGDLKSVVKACYKIWGAFHLVKNSKNSGSGLNGKRSSVRPAGKFPEKVELLRR